MKDKLKIGLILQSLSPFFLLIVIRHFHKEYLTLLCGFDSPFWSNWQSLLPEFLVFLLCLVLLVIAILYIPAFGGMIKGGFHSNGEEISAVKELNEAPVNFFMTFILPLMIDDLSSLQYCISYVIILVIVFSVISKTNLYYQSPVLLVLGYRVYSYEICNPATNVSNAFVKNKTYIGITREKSINNGEIIKWKYISDNVYLFYRD